MISLKEINTWWPSMSQYEPGDAAGGAVFETAVAGKAPGKMIVSKLDTIRNFGLAAPVLGRSHLP